MITLHKGDKELLESVQSYFKVGVVRVTNFNSVYFQGQRIEDINKVIIPHFINYPLITKKAADFELFKMAIEVINSKAHLFFFPKSGTRTANWY